MGWLYVYKTYKMAYKFFSLFLKYSGGEKKLQFIHFFFHLNNHYIIYIIFNLVSILLNCRYRVQMTVLKTKINITTGIFHLGFFFLIWI